MKLTGLILILTIALTHLPGPAAAAEEVQHTLLARTGELAPMPFPSTAEFTAFDVRRSPIYSAERAIIAGYTEDDQGSESFGLWEWQSGTLVPLAVEGVEIGTTGIVPWEHPALRANYGPDGEIALQVPTSYNEPADGYYLVRNQPGDPFEVWFASGDDAGQDTWGNQLTLGGFIPVDSALSFCGTRTDFVGTVTPVGGYEQDAAFLSAGPNGVQTVLRSLWDPVPHRTSSIAAIMPAIPMNAAGQSVVAMSTTRSPLGSLLRFQDDFEEATTVPYWWDDDVSHIDEDGTIVFTGEGAEGLGIYEVQVGAQPILLQAMASRTKNPAPTDLDQVHSTARYGFVTITWGRSVGGVNGLLVSDGSQNSEWKVYRGTEIPYSTYRIGDVTGIGHSFAGPVFAATEIDGNGAQVGTGVYLLNPDCTISRVARTDEVLLLTGGQAAAVAELEFMHDFLGFFQKGEPLDIVRSMPGRAGAVGVDGAVIFGARLANNEGNAMILSQVITTVGIGEDDDDEVLDPTGLPPVAVTLHPNAPNPFNPSTTISFGLPRAERVSLLVFNLRGERVRTLVAGRELAAGTHAREWNGQDDRGRAVASGTYFYRLQTGDRSISRRMLLVK